MEITEYRFGHVSIDDRAYSKDLIVVALSWFLVVGALYNATVIVGDQVWGGMAYFVFYAVIGVMLFGVGLSVVIP